MCGRAGDGMGAVTITNSRTGEPVTAWWLVLVVPVFLVGFVFYVLVVLTTMTIGTAILDAGPAALAGPAPVGVDEAFIHGMLALDHRLAGLVWEWAKR
jgi:hypothetical protein